MVWSLALMAMRWPPARVFDRLAAALAALLLGIWACDVMLADNAASEQSKARAEQTENVQGQPVSIPRAEHVIAGYGGAPYIHPSDVRIVKPGSSDLTLRNVLWEGRPFKSPVYYGIRTTHWSGSKPFGTMLDFTHSKAIAQRQREVELSGTRNGKRLPEKAKIEDVFQHFEFSHGHNTLTLNGVVRLADLVPRLAPYIGGGVGVALPHTEVKFVGENTRTYEYQLVGPAAQALLGIELRLPRTSLFVEYKFTIARYDAPLTNRDGGWFPDDFWRQAVELWRGDKAAEGRLTTTLASHQVAAGAGIRLGTPRAPASP